jgi:hypothetical protein
MRWVIVFLDFAKAVAWPIVVGISVIIFREEIRHLIRAVGAFLNRTKNVRGEIGGQKFDIELAPSGDVYGFSNLPIYEIKSHE